MANIIDYDKEFNNTFKHGLHVNYFLDFFGLFDIVKFDKYLRVPEDISTSDYVKKHYGESAVTLIENCISADSIFNSDYMKNKQ